MYPTVRKPYERERLQISTDKPSVVDTSHGNDTDVNNIVARFKRTGQMPPVPHPGAPGSGQYADVTGLQKDLTELVEESREALEKAEEIKREYEKTKQDENANKITALESEIAALKANQEDPPDAPE